MQCKAAAYQEGVQAEQEPIPEQPLQLVGHKDQCVVPEMTGRTSEGDNISATSLHGRQGAVNTMSLDAFGKA